MLALIDPAGVLLAAGVATAGEPPPPRDAIGKTLWDVVVASGDWDARRDLEEKVAQAARGEVVRCELPAPAGAGHAGLHLRLTPLGAHGTAVRFVLVQVEREIHSPAAVVGQAAHDINNRLGAIKNACVLMRDAVRPGSEAATDLRLIDEEIDRIAVTVSALYRRMSE